MTEPIGTFNNAREQRYIWCRWLRLWPTSYKIIPCPWIGKGLYVTGEWRIA